MSSGVRIQKALITANPVGVVLKRFGRPHDGGYVMVDDVTHNDFLISMGIANDVSFEQDMSTYVKGSHMYDFSIPTLPSPVTNGSFFKEKIGKDSHHIFKKVSPGVDIILKVDIEGSEWEFFEGVPTHAMLRCRQIVIEIHWAIVSNGINSPSMPVSVIEKISETHQLVVAHPNNYGGTVLVDGLDIPQVLELTFLRKSSYEFERTKPNLQNLLMPNNPTKPEIVLEWL